MDPEWVKIGEVEILGRVHDRGMHVVECRQITADVYFNPADVDYPVGLNLLEPGPPASRHLVSYELDLP
jgi:hypothetical protein